LGKLFLKNCRILESDTKVNIVISNNKISQILPFDEFVCYDNSYDMKGNKVLPGYIDLHIHGAGGGEVFKAEIEEFQKITSTLVKYGVTGITPTTIVNPENDYLQLRKLKDCMDHDFTGTRLLGLHLEGPFVNIIKKGGIPITSVRDYNRDELLKIINILGDHLKMMTIAPEISPNMEIIDILLEHNIVPALGHTNISYEKAHKAFDKGVKHVTHVFNAMPSLHHREPGPLLAILERKDVSVQIISDGVHLNPAIVQYLYNSIGIENCVCVSDGQSVIGLPDGKYDINGGLYLKNGEKATDIDGNLIGTALDVGNIAQKFQKFTGCTEFEANQSISNNPVKVLCLIDKYGSIEFGKIADLVVLDESGSIEQVFIDGALQYEKITD